MSDCCVALAGASSYCGMTFSALAPFSFSFVLLFVYSSSWTLTICRTQCPLIALWDTAESFTMFTQQGQGISPRVYVWADGVVFAGAAIVIGILVADIVVDLVEGWNVYEGTKEIICSTLLLVLMLLHSFLFFLCFCARLGRRKYNKKATPRAMYLPTSQPVTSKDVHIVEPQIVPLQAIQPVFPPPPQPPSPISPTLMTPESIQEDFRHRVPPSKPPLGPIVGTHCATPWPDAQYQPDSPRGQEPCGERDRHSG